MEHQNREGTHNQQTCMRENHVHGIIVTLSIIFEGRV